MENKPYKIINGNSLEVLDTLEENSVDAIITDPPYELGFMGKGWDKSGIAYNVELWKKALRVLKCGGYLLAFGGSRTFHRIACAVEDAGFEIRDTIMWLYGSGFPKSMNIGLMLDKKNGIDNTTGNVVKGVGSNNTNSMKNGLGESQEFAPYYEERKATNKWAGWGTQLKPAFEPIIVARKPVEDSVIDNVVKYGVGGINIDECRVPFEKTQNAATNPLYRKLGGYKLPEKGQESKGAVKFTSSNNDVNELGRFPANVIHDGSEEVISGMPDTKSTESDANYEFANQDNPSHLYTNVKSGIHFGDEGSASRYFYCAKASKKDRDGGLDMFEEKQVGSLAGGDNDKEELDDVSQRFRTKKRNIHPTVKPVELMQYLVRLVSPKGATILDIFNGSGSTGKAVMFENRERDANYKYIGIELDPEYCKISESRIDYALNKYEYDMIQDIKQEEERTGQLSLFDFGGDYGH